MELISSSIRRTTNFACQMLQHATIETGFALRSSSMSSSFVNFAAISMEEGTPTREKLDLREYGEYSNTRCLLSEWWITHLTMQCERSSESIRLASSLNSKTLKAHKSRQGTLDSLRMRLLLSLTA